MRTTQFAVAEAIQNALASGQIGEGRKCLDQWQSLQPVTLDTLNFLRYYRAVLGQFAEAIDAVRAMIPLRQEDAAGRMCDHLRLSELHLATGDVDKSWAALTVVLEWPELPKYFSVGLARTAVELAFDISAAAGDDGSLSDRAFRSGVQMLDRGCSRSLVLLEKGRECSRRLRRKELLEWFDRAIIEERKRIQFQPDGQ
jgi:tetratricopeptide (TPR) repeat protein